MSLKTTGGVSHSLCVAYFCNLGSKVSIPLFDDAKYDLIVDDGKSLSRIQCKTSHVINRAKIQYPRIGLGGTRNQKHYIPSDFDYLWTITSEFAYLIPMSDIPVNEKGYLVSITLSPKYNAYKVNIGFLSSGKDPRRSLTTPHLTQLEKDRVVSLFRLGETSKTIALTMGLTQDHVEGFLYQNNVKKEHLLTPEIKKDIIDMYNKGFHIRDIVYETKFTRSAIQSVVKEADLTRRKISISPQLKQQIIDLYVSGKTPAEISSIVQIGRVNTISSFIHRHKWLVDETRAKLASQPIAST